VSVSAQYLLCLSSVIVEISFPMGRMGDTGTSRTPVLILASDKARYITAAEIVVDGGMTVAHRLNQQSGGGYCLRYRGIAVAMT
jgi:hypothetical protein